MAGYLTNYLEKKVLDHILKTASYSPPAANSIFLALFSVTPGPTGGGTEAAYTNYQRQAIPFGAAAARAIAQNALVTFPQCGSSGDTAAYWGLFDLVSGGNLLAYGSLSVTQGIVNGNTPSVASGQVSVSFQAGVVFTGLADTILNWLFAAGSLSQPTHVKVGLSTSTPADDGTGITEPSGNNYSQETHDGWNAASPVSTVETATNNLVITMPTPSGSWGLITYGVLYLDTTPAVRATVPNQTPNSGDTVEWLDTAFTVSLQ